ncbi:VanZ family protein [Microbacterium alcoholitolerans]|uniref:VanZ family protein n=1 Tax=unclassified Microbacterium TaxID=2609290 RepID=UPI003D163E7E
MRTVNRLILVEEQAVLAAIAIGIGVIVGIGLFVPFVALSYRRRGRLSLGRMLLWFAALVYFWAIWTYTLLPLPDPDAIRCVGMITDPLDMVRDVRKAIAAPGRTLTNPAVLQLAFNVLLFVPLGFFLRVLGGRGIIAALLVGFGLSLFIETTQLTGVWGIYPCAYRFFDVGDLITNTTGALLGSILALVVPRAHRGLAVAPDAGRPRPVTRGRRALAMLCDGIGFSLLAWTISIATQLYVGYVLDDRALMVEGELAGFVGTACAAALWLLFTLATGQSIGDFSVQLRYRGSRLPEFVARLLRWAGGVAALTAFGLLPQPFGFASGLLLLLACVLFVFTRQGRGLPGILSGQQLTDAREQRADARRQPAS